MLAGMGASSLKTDVLIAGAGPAGLSMALALGGPRCRRPLAVMVVDPRDPTTTLDGDSRGTALTRATQAMLRALGVWDQLAPQVQDMRDVMVTDGAGGPHDGRPTLLSFSADDAGGTGAAAMVENSVLNAALLAAVQLSPAITLVPQAAVTGLETGSGLARVALATGAGVTASLVIGADGRASPLRKMLGIGTKGHDYGQTALSFSISHELPHNACAEEHFSPHGVFAYLPLPGNRGSIVWGDTPAEAQRLMALDDDAFNTALAARMGGRLGRVALDGRRIAYPLALQLADARSGPRTALIGDAAHAIHPLAGLGLNLGFKDVAALADCVASALARGDDIGSAAVLARYERARRFDTLATALAMDGLNGLFVNSNPLLRQVRGFGLRAINRLPAARRALLAEAAGQGGDVPRLMQGLQAG